MAGPPRLRAIFFDLDDTLVLTEDADRAAFRCVASLAEELLPGLNGRQLVNDWRPLFHASPWCPEGKVGCPRGMPCSCFLCWVHAAAPGCWLVRPDR